MSHWIVATDFDGTLSAVDVGNEIYKSIQGQERFDFFHKEYRAGRLGLKDLQRQMWDQFPCDEATFIRLAKSFATLKAGVNTFLEKCLDHQIPVFVASCGIQQYIDTVLKTSLTKKAFKAIHGIRCNQAQFSNGKLSQFIPPQGQEQSLYPLDKGAWCLELSEGFSERPQILGIGNGTSDRSFANRVHLLAATESLAKWCIQEKVEHRSFESFNDLLEIEIFDESRQ